MQELLAQRRNDVENELPHCSRGMLESAFITIRVTLQADQFLDADQRAHMPVRMSVCGHSTSSPAPLSMMPRRMMMKCLAGITLLITCKGHGMLLSGEDEAAEQDGGHHQHEEREHQRGLLGRPWR
jgi:hypothetical protein